MVLCAPLQDLLLRFGLAGKVFPEVETDAQGVNAQETPHGRRNDDGAKAKNRGPKDLQQELLESLRRENAGGELSILRLTPTSALPRVGAWPVFVSAFSTTMRCSACSFLGDPFPSNSTAPFPLQFRYAHCRGLLLLYESRSRRGQLHLAHWLLTQRRYNGLRRMSL